MEKKTKSISVKLSDDLYEWLIQEAELDERTKSAIMIRALREYKAKRESHSCAPTLPQ